MAYRTLRRESWIGKFEDSTKFERKGVVAKIVSFLLVYLVASGEAVFLVQRYSASSAEWNICWENIAFRYSNSWSKRRSGIRWPLRSRWEA